MGCTPTLTGGALARGLLLGRKVTREGIRIWKSFIALYSSLQPLGSLWESALEKGWVAYKKVLLTLSHLPQKLICKVGVMYVYVCRIGVQRCDSALGTCLTSDGL